MSVFVRAPDNYDVDAVSRETSFADDSPSMTQQSFADECDINTIVKRFGLTGQLPEPLQPQYGDFSGVSDFQSAMNAVRSASEGFMTLPADLRARFNNDAGAFVEFFHDSKNRDQAIEWGLIPRPPVPDLIRSVPSVPSS